ncbi:hypothetical protein SLEP1_g56867 [Rubroshorea leprosula]|uniref:Uncharacterized protein n=1 Tax=Rubroshorea leprosula TaxID=152421 RepID=A0AAV5MMB5_9ROSI|nr:hypothetical protein SLEP1_g56867 [Rubroshorea leprosula]
MAGALPPPPSPCVFCQIAGKSSSTPLLHSDDKVVTFQDIKPAAFRHYLVIPVEHIPSVKDLRRRSEDYSLVLHMLNVGQTLLRKDAPEAEQVPRLLYEVNEKAYEPEIISIGPYHRGKNHLNMMEVHKVRFLRMLLRRTNEHTADPYEHTAEPYVAALRGMVEKARNCYSEPSSMSTEDFLEMLVLDGCFIVEFIHQFSDGNRDEYVFGLRVNFYRIFHDLILFENQLPFFVLWELFGIMWGIERNFYVTVLLELFSGRMPGLGVDFDDDNTSIENVKHLLDLVRGKWLPSREVMEYCSRAPEDANWSFIRSTTELKEAGIRFKKGEGDNLFDIKFRNGVLEIPMIKIVDSTERLYRNVIACEQFEKENPKYFTEFARFMDCLINSGKDVELLCHCGIIENWLGSDEAVAAMFNRLTDNVWASIKFYTQIYIDVNEYYNKPRNKRMASLRHNYFNTPWAFISFLAAAFLLLLALLQTVFTIFPRH